MLNHLHPGGNNGEVVPSVSVRMIPVKHTRVTPPRFFAFKNTAVMAALNAYQ